MKTRLARTSVLVALLGLAGTLACGPKSPAALPPTLADADAAPPTARGDAEFAPTPYTAEQIRDATRVGRSFAFRIEAAGKPTVTKTMTFVTVGENDTETSSTIADEHGAPVDPPTRARATWIELQRHARFPQRDVAITDASVTTPAGTFECKLYTVTRGNDVMRFWFANTMPGPPVRVEITKAGASVGTHTLVSYRPGM